MTSDLEQDSNIKTYTDNSEIRKDKLEKVRRGFRGILNTIGNDDHLIDDFLRFLGNKEALYDSITSSNENHFSFGPTISSKAPAKKRLKIKQEVLAKTIS